MDLFEKNYRTLMTRKLTLTQDEMDNYRIKRIYNSVCSFSSLNDDEALTKLENHIDRGEYCLLETADNGKVYISSLIIFGDEWSRNIFGLKYPTCTFGDNDYLTISN